MREISFNNYFWQNETVRLRAVQEKDWEDHYYNLFDSGARQLLEAEVELPPTEERSHEFAEKFKNFAQGTGRIMFTIENMKGENVGGANINSIDMKNGTFSIGMQIDRDHRGKGYGTAAMSILLDYAFFERRLNKFNDRTLAGNEGSGKMMERLGCIVEGQRRQCVYMNGKYQDEILYGLTQEEWRRTRGK